MREHTPGPWRVSGQEILSGKGSSIVCIGTVFHSPGIMEPGEREANAAFIVKACNGYKELVDAAHAMVTAWDEPTSEGAAIGLLREAILDTEEG